MIAGSPRFPGTPSNFVLGSIDRTVWDSPNQSGNASQPGSSNSQPGSSNSQQPGSSNSQSVSKD
jgi:hypothetical protein